MEFEIHYQCETCDGYGDIEDVRDGVNAAGPWVEHIKRPCEDCDGGLIMTVDTYDSVADVKADYPLSFVKHEGKWV